MIRDDITTIIILLNTYLQLNKTIKKTIAIINKHTQEYDNNKKKNNTKNKIYIQRQYKTYKIYKIYINNMNNIQTHKLHAAE